MGYRDEALAKLDVRAFLSTQGVDVGKKVGTNEYRIRCPNPGHTDAEPSANVNLERGLWHCKACNASGGPIDLLMQRGASYKEALTEIGRLAGMEPPSSAKHTNGAAGTPSPAAPSSVTKSKLTEANVKAWHETGLRNVELQRWFHEHRGFTDETIATYELGWDGTRVTIPVRDTAGHLINVRRYMRNASSEQGKMLSLVAGAGPDVTTRLFPGDELPDEVLLVEGEWDAMICRQNGLRQAYTVTIGAGNWNPNLTPLFRDKTVTIAYDNDDAGRKGAIRVAAILSHATPAVFLCQIPNLPEKGDPTHFFVEQQRDVAELRGIISDATPYVVSAAAPDEGPGKAVPLHRASDARYRGQRLELPVLLSGKAMTPYTIPYEFTVTCDMSNKRFCGVCPMQEANGRKDVQLRASEVDVLSLIGVSTTEQQKAIRALAKAVPQCNRPLVEVKRAINVEEIRLIPELDASNNDDDEAEYVARRASSSATVCCRTGGTRCSATATRTRRTRRPSTCSARPSRRRTTSAPSR
jgi:hypothetical protein